MSQIFPFQAWRYDPKQVPIQQVVTQPYDKITPELQDKYYQSSPYNLVRIILGKEQPQDDDHENVYTRAAASFQNWRQAGVLRRDPEASIYRYSQTFTIPMGAPGYPAQTERQGFIALARLEDYSAGVVFRHEQTLVKPKADRLNLLRSTRAHFGQIFMLYNGAGKVDAALDTSAAPDIEVTDEYKVVHRVWKVSSPAVISAVQSLMQDRKLVIADGHHRYETSLAYRNERRAEADTSSDIKRPAPYDMSMMTFVDMDRRRLVILPTHRLVFGLQSFSSSSTQFEAEAQKFFQVDKVDPGIDAAAAAAMLEQTGQAGTALLAITSAQAFLLHSPKAVGPGMLADFSPRQQALDVVQLHKCILEGILKISEAAIRNQENVTYCREIADGLSQVRSGKVQVAFLMNPARIEQVRDIAFAGEVMPQKSTDFYPKLLSGLTIYAMD
jgi:uncharacterized protein (DUF1015 family)